MADEVTVAWDAYTEPDFAVYNIYVGKMSRFATATDFIKKWCDEKEPTNDKCVEEWLEICKTEYRNYHSMLYCSDRVNFLAKKLSTRSKRFWNMMSTIRYQKG
jgi:hypothetical protein